MGLRDRLFKRQDDDDSRNIEEDDIGMAYSSRHDVYISYSTKDKDIADEVCHVLEKNMLKCWIAPRNLTSSTSYADEISNAVSSSRIVVLVFSKNSNQSPYVKNEIQQAFAQKKPIIAFKIDEKLPDGEMEFMLMANHWIDAYPSPEDKFESLVKDAARLMENNDNEISSESTVDADTKDRHSPEVYITYSSKDKNTADEVCYVLEQNGMECWIAPRNIRSGENYAQQITEGIKGSKIVVLIFSRNSMESVFVNKEVQMAFDHNKPILSFKIDETLPEGEMEFYLKNKHWLDAYPSPRSEFERLVKDASKLIDDADDGAESHENTGKKLSVKNRDNPNKPDIFISYNETDSDIASEVCNALEDRNMSCWLKGRHHGQKGLIDATFDALKASKLFVVIFSKHSKNSNYVNTEVDIAFTSAIQIFAFQVDETRLEGGLEFFLSNKHWIDASSNFNDGLNRLINDALLIVSPTLESHIDFSTTSDIVTAGDVIALSGILTGESEQISGGKVDICREDELLDTVLSSGSGKFSALVPVKDTGLYRFRATFKGNKRYTACKSEEVLVEVVDNITHDDSADFIKRPFKAYQGDEPYIFISYAHKDAQLVFPEIKVFHDEGYPIWYDQGLTPGQEWDDEVARALINCSLLVVFISENSMSSNNVQDEIKLALKRNINIVPIYFEDTELPPGLELRLSNKHAIMKYKMDRDDYIPECFKAFNKERIPKIDFND